MSKIIYIALVDVTANCGTVKSKHRTVDAALATGVPRSHVRRTRFAVKRGERIWTSETRAA